MSTNEWNPLHRQRGRISGAAVKMDAAANGEASSLDRAVGDLKINFGWYGVLCIMTFLFSSLYYVHYANTLEDKPTSLAELGSLFAGKNPPLKAAPTCGAAEVDCKIDALAKRIHPLQNARDAMVKSLIVVSISLLWFRTFLLVRRYTAWVNDTKRRQGARGQAPPWWQFSVRSFKWIVIFVSILPAIIFALAMVEAYEPAVFVMALAAIYVAAEHYCGLEKAEENLNGGVRHLNGGVRHLNGGVRRLNGGVQLLTKHVETLLNADGMNTWRRKMYEEYREADHRIDAVVRYFDIDTEWWRCSVNQDTWAEYVRRSGLQPELLLNVLTDKRCQASILFVADLPMPLQKVTDQRMGAMYFRDLMGLAWQLAVFAEVRKVRAQRLRSSGGAAPRYVRVIISKAPTWMHVIDQKTYQVIEREELTQSCVRSLHRDVRLDSERIKLSDWARRNVRQFASRGTLGEEHLLATLRHAALRIPLGEDDDIGRVLKPVLNFLGLEHYLSSRIHHQDFVVVQGIVAQEDGRSATKDELVILESRDVAERLCVSVFEAFLRSVDRNTNPLRVRDLANGGL